MTLLVAWTGIDSRGPASIYLVSDSLISWGDEATFDFGRKVFAFNQSSDIIGYCGDVLFPSIAINQIVQLADVGLLFQPDYTCKQKFDAIVNKLNQIFAKYPHMHEGITKDSLQIVHASKEQKDNSKFFCHLIGWSRDKGWYGKEVELPDSSDVLLSIGSGAKEFNKNYIRYQSGKNKSTSRNVFHCFCDTLLNIKDPYCGGAPQLVGVYRKPNSPGLTFGIIYKDRRYFLGVQIDNLKNFDSIEWRNIDFELCGGQTKERFSDAQLQPDKLRRL